MKYKKIIIMFFLMLIAMITIGCETETEDPVGTEGLIYEQLEYRPDYAVVGYEGDSENIVVSATYNGMPVTTIKTGALCDLAIESIELPDTITCLEQDSIDGSCLLEFTIPKNLYYFAQAFGSERSHLDFIVPEDHAYFKEVLICEHEAVVSKDETVLLAVVKKDIYDKNFDFTLPDTYKEIAPYAFSGVQFKDMNIPESVDTIDSYAFAFVNASSITIISPIETIERYTFYSVRCPEIVLPDTVEEIKEMAFYNARIKSFDFPTGCKTIGEKAFYSSYLTGELILPEGLETIGSKAFNDCYLTSIVFPSTLTDMSTEIFGNNEYGFGWNAVRSIRFNNISFTDMDLVDYFYQYILNNYTTSDDSGRIIKIYPVGITIILPQDPTEAVILETAFREAWGRCIDPSGASPYKNYTEDAFIFESASE